MTMTERERLQQIDAERIASLSNEERLVVVKAYRTSLPLPNLPRKHGERLRSLGMAIRLDVDGWFRRYPIYRLTIFGGEVARKIISETVS
jgi:hypothetical protein